MANPVAVITGASRGIGKQLAQDLAHAGYDIVCAARSTSDRRSALPGTVDETADLVRAAGRRAVAVGLDVRDDAAVVALAERVFEEWGRCDLLINNAAIAPPTPALEDSVKRWRLAVDINLNGPFQLMHAFCNRMLSGEGGRVVNVSSSAANLPEFGRASYTATKRGLEGMSEVLAVDLRGRVAVNVLRIDLPIWSEGFGETLSAEDAFAFEHPVIASDAVKWLAQQPLSHSGVIHDLTRMRSDGISAAT